MPDGVGEGWDVPQEERDRVVFHWFHVAPGTHLVLVILSAAPLWYVGHFEKGRMIRCEGDGCRRCLSGVGRQVRWVFCGVELSTRRLGVMEVSESVAVLLKQWAMANGTARGLIVEVSKATKSKHSRMDLELIRELPPVWAVQTEALNLREVMLQTWGRMEG